MCMILRDAYDNRSFFPNFLDLYATISMTRETVL